MKRTQKGFTLVEIAIVLVIIGLLLGGILKGQEMITQAKIKTERNEAHDVFYVTDGDGQKVQETLRLDQLRRGLEAALT